jgi:hypothetical protein
MADLSEKNRAAARAAMPEIARMKSTNPDSGVRSKVTAVGTSRHFKTGGAVHSDVKQDKALISKMIKSADAKEGKGMACGGKMRMAAGGAAKVRRGFPNTTKAPGRSSTQITTKSK